MAKDFWSSFVLIAKLSSGFSKECPFSFPLVLSSWMTNVFYGQVEWTGGVNNKWSVACTSSLLCFYYYRATKQVLSKQSKAHAIVAIISCWWLFLWLYWTRGPFLSVPHITHYICYSENAMHCSLTWGGNKMQWKSRVVSIVARNLVFISPHFLFHCICA